MIFVDSNIPMYLVGAEHPNKAAAVRLVERVIARRERLVTSAEVFQEILHRYAAIDRPDAIQPAFDALSGIVDEVVDVSLSLVEEARSILLGRTVGTARDALHVATMRRFNITRILTFDRGFDPVPGVERLS